MAPLTPLQAFQQPLVFVKMLRTADDAARACWITPAARASLCAAAGAALAAVCEYTRDLRPTSYTAPALWLAANTSGGVCAAHPQGKGSLGRCAVLRRQ